ncbi:HDOD domain-containing protein [Opitutus sp. ER46]|uniref:HDOD domain-containing protein n=1 Tax=Opitutus sp. ER46 TaxID=2161864 RepID=UPI001304EDA2|nr:HDOD domain-containing protein [Opitutus sp. ER46]
MANILLLDDSEVAGRAMRGILGKAGHRCAVATNPDDAWRILREGVLVDLVFVELLVVGNLGMGFILRLRDDPYFKNLPVVVYTAETDTKQVRKALDAKVQNYLIKPYREQVIFAEVAKAAVNPWRSLLFEEPRSFCAQLGFGLDTLTKMRRQVMLAYDEAVNIYPGWARSRDNAEVYSRLDTLANDAESAGIWAGVDYVRSLREQAELGNWDAFKECAPMLDFASRLIFCQINPDYIPDVLKPAEEIEETRQAAERPRWMNVDVDVSGPVLTAGLIEKEVAGLNGCPVIDTAAATFAMAADGRVTSMTRCMELGHDDPGICAQLLIAANRLDRDDGATIDDAKAAVTLLGEIRLNALAKSTLMINEKYLRVPPLSWPDYWMFLVGVARVSQYICQYLEFDYLRSVAYTAGLLHDIGKLLLLRLHPWGFAATVRYAQQRKVPLRDAERKYLGCTTRDLAVQFATNQKLPPTLVEVIRSVETPLAATQYAELVAIVALARHICLHNRMGHCGDTPGDSCPPIVSTEAWQVLEQRLFPSFDLRKFEAQAHACCREMRMELLGQQQRHGVRPRPEAAGELAGAS